MKIIIFILSLSSINLPAEASATKLSTRKPNQVAVDAFALSVTFGDKITKFHIWSDGTTRHFEASSAEKSLKKSVLSEENYAFLLRQAGEVLNQQTNETIYCRRNYIELSALLADKVTKKIGCVGSKTSVALKLTDLANALDLLN